MYVPQGTILEDAPCRRCGYNLRGLDHSGRCPECGTPAAVSICGDLLRFSHPHWLRQVAEGLNLILWGVLASVVVRVLSVTAFRGEPAAAQFLAMLASLIGAWGTWQMTSPDPSGIGETAGVNARKLVRAAVVAGLAASLVQWLATAGGLSLGGVVGLSIFGLACGLVTTVGEFAKLQYIGRLADRIPDESLSSRANTLKWGLAICYGAMLVVGAIAAVAVATMMASAGRVGTGAPAGLGVGLGAFACLLAPVGIALLVVAIMTIGLIYRMGQAVRAQVPLAVAIWNRAAAMAQRGGPGAPGAPRPAPAPATGPAPAESAATMRPRF